MFLKVIRVLELDGDSAEPEASTSSATTSKKWGAPAVFPSNWDVLRGLPVPDYFESLVTKEWEHPYKDRICLKLVFKFYNLEPDFMQRLKSPLVDAPVAALGYPSILPTDTESLPKNQIDKRFELGARKAFEASAAALRAFLAGSLFDRAAVLWIQQMLKDYELPPEGKK